MQELWKQKNEQYQKIKKQIIFQNKQIESQLQVLQNQLDELESNNKNQQFVYEKRMREALPQTKTKLQKAMEYNKNLFAIEMKNHVCKIEELKNLMQINVLYLTRVWAYLEYYKSIINGNSISQITTYYQLLNVIQSEAIKRIQSEEEKYNNELDISSDYSTFLNICLADNYGNIDYLRAKTLKEDKKKQYEAKKTESSIKLKDWKNIFKTKKINLSEEILEKNVLMGYDMEDIIGLFNIEEKKKVA